VGPLSGRRAVLDAFAAPGRDALPKAPSPRATYRALIRLKQQGRFAGGQRIHHVRLHWQRDRARTSHHLRQPVTRVAATSPVLAPAVGGSGGV
jgi:hypothetical protein